MYIFSFEKLEVWVESKDLTSYIYTITNKFPESEKFGLTSQIRRASISICSNIAEGTSRITNKDKAHFLSISFSSTMEVLNQLILSNELKYISEDEYLICRKRIESITNELNSLRKHILSSNKV
jgi:four helix bundle protein